MHIEPLNDSFSEFDKLVDALEQSAESKVQLNDARKWVVSKFYGDLPTLSSLRLSAGLSQKQLANSCEIEQPHVSRYESGRHVPSLEIAALMSSVFGVTLDEFFLAWRNTQAQIK
jgi:DNA-binding XRE family transcriptional regulator